MTMRSEPIIGWYRHATLSMVALAFLTALRANGEEDVLKKSLSRRSRHRSQKQPTLFNPRRLLISRSWFPSVLPKSGGCSFVSSANNLSRLPATWPGPGFRRAHQALARLCHYKRRAAILIDGGSTQ